jgi:hypothetical protein
MRQGDIGLLLAQCHDGRMLAYQLEFGCDRESRFDPLCCLIETIRFCTSQTEQRKKMRIVGAQQLPSAKNLLGFVMKACIAESGYQSESQSAVGGPLGQCFSHGVGEVTMIAHHPGKTCVATVQLDAVRKLLDSLSQDLERIDPIARHDAQLAKREHRGSGIWGRQQRHECRFCLLESSKSGKT